VKGEPKRTSIRLVCGTAFAGVATRREYLILTLMSDHGLASRRVHKRQKTSAARFHREIRVASPDDVDGELVAWLEQAYILSP
jgi:hypothetical protein